MNKKKVYEENTNLRAIIISSLVAVLGGICLYFSNLLISPWDVFVSEIGSLFIVSFAVGIIWELALKRSFSAEVISKVGLTEEIEQTGLIGISAQWHGRIDWEECFKGSKSITIFFIYGRTWRNTNREFIKNFSRRKDTELKVILPDYKNKELMSELSRSIQYTTDELERLIKDAIKDFTKLASKRMKEEGKISIWLSNVFPVYCCYLFDSHGIFTLYSLTKEKVEVPTFQVKSGGQLYKFLSIDIDTILNPEKGVSRKLDLSVQVKAVRRQTL